MNLRNEFFIALNNWQNGWNEKQVKKDELSISLKQECSLIQDKYKVTNELCYRKRFIHTGELVDMFLNDHKTEGLASWTSDVRYAEFFKGRYRENAITAAVFEHKPVKGEVILNVCALWKCSDFIAALENFKHTNLNDCNAIYNFKDTQKEIILEAPLKASEICMLSAKSSPFDDICDKANIPEVDRPKEFKRLIDAGALIEEIRYIKDKSARNAVQNTVREFYKLITRH